MRRLTAVVVSSIALLAMLASPAAAQTQVNCTGDPTALTTAVAAAGPGARIVVSGTCTGHLVLNKDLTLVGAAPGATLVGEPFVGVLAVAPTAVVNLQHLSITSITTTPGMAQVQNDGTLNLTESSISNGAIDAIRNSGTLVLRGSSLEGNHGKGDAPIDNEGGSVTLLASRVVGNRNTELLGAVANRAGGAITLVGSTISDNSGSGGVIANDGTLTVIGSTISGNLGFASVLGNAGVVTLRNSVVSGNAVERSAAPIQNNGTMTLTNTVVSDNRQLHLAECDGKCEGAGAIDNRDHGILVVQSSAVNGNAGADGGGISNAGAVTMRASSVEGNTALGHGGGMFSATAATATLVASSVTGNTAGIDGGGIFNEGSLSLRAVTIRSNDPNDCVGC